MLNTQRKVESVYAVKKATEEVMMIKYYNVIFYLFFKTGMDDFKRRV